jgi:phosphopantetheinyl transferase
MFAPFEAPVDGDVAVLGAVIPPALYDRDAFEWLSPEDTAVLAGLGSKRRRVQFAAGRWLLRRAAARAFGDGRYELHTSAGRPFVFASGTPAAVSVSHSSDVVLCAAGRVRALGVDVERIRPRRGWAALAGLVLHPLERASLDGVPEAQRWEGFYRAWTCKEALAKALGVGVFALSLDRIRVSRGVVREAPPDEVPDLACWKLRELSVGKATAAAVAWRK